MCMQHQAVKTCLVEINESITGNGWVGVVRLSVVLSHTRHWTFFVFQVIKMIGIQRAECVVV